MKFFLFFVVSIQINVLFSQKNISGIYIEPSLFWKISTNLSENQNIPLDLPNVKIQTMRVIFPYSIAHTSAGLNMGYEFKNHDKIQAGVAHDGSPQGVKIQAFESFPGTSNRYGLSTYEFSGSPLIFNFSLLFKKSLINNSSSTESRTSHKIHLVFGLHYFYKPNNGINLMDQSEIRINAPDSITYFVTISEYVIPQNFFNSLKINFGVDFTFGNKKQEWFSLNVNCVYSGGKQYFSNSNIKIQKSQSGKPDLFYSYHINGTGNGIYFTLSRRIFPWKRMALLKASTRD